MKPGEKKRALVVEDEPLIRMTICDMLEELGIAFIEADNGRDALKLLEGEASLAVLIADLGLPDIRGEDLVKSARSLRPHLKIVVATGRSADTGKTNPVFEGVAFLEKPFDVAQLGRAIASA
jgi:CheY-like chemotaxis protein